MSNEWEGIPVRHTRGQHFKFAGRFVLCAFDCWPRKKRYGFRDFEQFRNFLDDAWINLKAGLLGRNSNY